MGDIKFGLLKMGVNKIQYHKKISSCLSYKVFRKNKLSALGQNVASTRSTITV